MKNKLTTYLSIFLMMTSFLAAPLTVLAETNDSSGTQATQSESMQPAEAAKSTGITKEKADQQENPLKKSEEVTTSKSDTLKNTQTDQKQASATTQSTNQQTRAPNQTKSIQEPEVNAEENSLSITSSLSYPSGQDYVVATSDWLTVAMDLTLPAMKMGDTVKLTVANSDWAYSDQPFVVGDYTIIPDSKKDGTFIIKANTDTLAENIKLDINIRYKENLSSSKVTQELPISIQYQNQVSSDNKYVEIHRFKDTIPKNEFIKKVAYGINEDGNALWGLYFNYNNFNLRGNDTVPFIFKDISDKGQKIIPESILAYDVSKPTLEVDGSMERNPDHDEYNYMVSKYLIDHVNDGILDIQSNSSNPLGLDDITKSFYIFFETKPEKQPEVGEVLSNKVNVQIAGENGETQKDESEASVTIPPINNGEQFIKISGTKTWADNDNQDGKRPDKITVNLLADGQQIATKDVTQADGWAYEFKNLPKFKNGKEIGYTVTENQVADYNTDIKGFDITNSYTPGKTSISVTKQWEDANNQDGKRPNSIQVQLKANGESQGHPVTLNAANNWTTTWNDLPQKAKGQDIVYTVEESAVPGYITTVDASDKGNVKIVNIHTPESTEVKGTKTWADNDNQDGKRPDKITVNLLADGQQVAEKEITEADGWQYNFSNLPKFKNGKEIVYTLTENAVENYTVSMDGYNITNTYSPGEVSGTVTKHWEDSNDQARVRPESIKIQLYANGKEQGKPVEVKAKDNWTYTWTHLKITDKTGKVIQYSLKEIGVPTGYTAAITGENTGNLLITNTYTPVNSTKPNQPTKPENSTIQKFEKWLPKTGEEKAAWLTIIGAFLVCSVVGYLYFRKKAK
ncbi:Cna B-type domain-containing protein [Enterococcus sp. AZ072]|uniref:Cna B-type domain-containing protein n=1 Tax=unclassified Enterococcus TaxID=2608891 RepID=UPI003D2B8A57